MKKLIAVAVCVTLMIATLSGCSKKVWEFTNRFENGGIVIASQDGEEFYFGLRDYYIAGIKKGKKLGTLSSEHMSDTSTFYSFDGDNSGKYMISFSGESIYDKYFFVGLDGGCTCYIYVKSGEEWEYDYHDPNVASAAFIPYDDIPEKKELNYEKYVDKHGIFGDNAKEVMGSILSEPLDFDAYRDVIDDQYIVARRLGRLVFYLDGVDWFCFDAEVRYHSVYGLYISFDGWYGSDCYLVSDESAVALGIELDGED